MAIQFPPEQLAAIAEDVAALLRERKETVSIAETAAGGLISAALLSVDGASRFYKGWKLLDRLQVRCCGTLFLLGLHEF